jgi:hypothetical protein
MKRAGLLAAVAVTLWVAYQPNVFAEMSFGPSAFTILGFTLLIVANRLRHKINKS